MESQAVVVVVLLRRRRNGAAGGSRRGRVARFASNDDLAKGLLDRGCGWQEEGGGEAVVAVELAEELVQVNVVVGVEEVGLVDVPATAG